MSYLDDATPERIADDLVSHGVPLAEATEAAADAAYRDALRIGYWAQRSDREMVIKVALGMLAPNALSDHGFSILCALVTDLVAEGGFGAAAQRIIEALANGTAAGAALENGASIEGPNGELLPSAFLSFVAESMAEAEGSDGERFQELVSQLAAARTLGALDLGDLDLGDLDAEFRDLLGGDPA